MQPMIIALGNPQHKDLKRPTIKQIPVGDINNS